MARRRPYRAHVFLPGHGEGGVRVLVTRVACCSQKALEEAVTRYRDEGYWVTAWEELEMDLPTQPE